ncbi:MAG: hypothetical protein FWC01_06610 [Treponema sp.]|nr:hypothetical protein [Treponema sp.]MCL2237613.1 hypothetical protein [Treponema sp.]
MKTKALFLVVFLCFCAAGAYSQEQAIAVSPPLSMNRVAVSWELVNMVVNSGSNLYELNYFLSEPLTIIIEDPNIDPSFAVNDGTLMFSEQYIASMVVQLTISNPGRMHIFYDTPEGGEVFEIIFTVQNRFITLRFRRNNEPNNFILFSAIINGKPYSLTSENRLPHLIIGSNLTLR